MKDPLESLARSSKLGELQLHQIAIVRALPGLGDMLCAVPALRALRTAFPKAQITLLGLPMTRPLIDRFLHYVDEFLEFPGYPGLPERTPPIHQLPAFFNEMQQRGFDLALQMHGNGMNINAFTALLGARFNAGFFLSGQYCPDERFFLPYPNGEPEIRRNLRLLEFLGIPLQGEALEFPLGTADWQAWEKLKEASGLQASEYVCIHPGAQWPDKRWPADRFATVADSLATHGWQIVLTGTAGEAEQTQAVIRAMKAQVIDLTGRTSLGALAILLQRARLLISNCTGVSHLAAALRVPSVVIFSNSDPDRWAPLDHERHRAIYTLAGDRPDTRCDNGRCLGEDCRVAGWKQKFPFSSVAPEMIVAQANALLQEENL